MNKSKGLIRLKIKIPHRERKEFPAGFTLIELLVVISIIILLIAILMPIAQRARNQARAVCCQATLKQWGLAWSMYTEQNDYKFPDGSHFDWRTEFEDYYPSNRNRKFLICPRTVTTADKGAPPKYAITVDSVHGLKSSYAINEYISDFGISSGKIINPREWWSCDVPNTNNIPVMSDAYWHIHARPDANSPPPPYDGRGPYRLNDEMSVVCIDRHNGGINVLFMDWSVRKVGLKELWTLKWHRNCDTGGPWTIAGGVQPDDRPEWMRKFKDY